MQFHKLHIAFPHIIDNSHLTMVFKGIVLHNIWNKKKYMKMPMVWKEVVAKDKQLRIATDLDMET